MKNVDNDQSSIFRELMISLKRPILICLILIGIQSTHAAGNYQQSTKLSLRGTGMSLIQIFDKIEENTEFLFNYKDADVLGIKKDINISDNSIDEILRVVLEDTNLEYTIKNKHVSIYRSTTSIDPFKIKGQVTDELGSPMIGVTVAIKNTAKGVMTDLDGYFSIEIAEEGMFLSFSYVGYMIHEVSVSPNQTEINVQMNPRLTDLDEVVVVGYGVQKKVNLTGAVGVVSSKDLTVRPAGQTSSAMQGILPGVTITQSSGQPGGDGGTIRIRGIGTLNNASPLILVDGVEGSMNDVEPNMIESVSVLKDAASAAIYGSRAANGVILVTTKRGGSGKYTASYSAYGGWQKATDMPKMVDALGYMQLADIAKQNDGSDPIYTDMIEAYRKQNGIHSDEYPNTDWQKETLKGSGFQHNHYFNISGGSEMLRTSTSISFLSQDGLVDNVNFRRLSIRNNMDWKLSNKLSAKVDFQFVNPRRSTPSTGPTDIFQWMNGLPANQLARNSDGSWGVGWNGVNPVSHTYDSGFNLNKIYWGSLNASLIYKPVEWMTAELNVAPKYVSRTGKKLTKKIQTYLPDGTPSYASPRQDELTNSHATELYNNYKAILTAEKSLSSGHTGKIMLGFSQEDYKYSGFSAYRDSIDTNFPVLGTGGLTNRNNTEDANDWALRSFFGRVNYDYQQKYLFEANFRYDGSSRFKKGNKYSFFPSFSGGWRVSEESFMDNSRYFLNDAKIRASWGQLGNQMIGNYAFMSMLQYGAGAMDGSDVMVGALNTMPNSNIQWETTSMFDVGIDLTLFNKLTITADYYARRTKDILLSLDIPLIVGLGAPVQNAGEVDNKGWEFAIGYRDKVGEFNYGVNFNISDVKNKILDLKGQDGTGLTANRTGYAINSLYGYVAEGYFQSKEEIEEHATQFGNLSVGDIKYTDINKDGVINGLDKQVMGSTIPRYTFGLNLTAEYKGFDIAAFFQGVGKADGYLSGAGIWPFAVSGAVGGTARQDAWDYWTEDNTDAKYPRLSFSGSNNRQHSTFWKNDAKYLRLKNLQVGYTLPKKLTNKIDISRLRIFANGTNLFSLDNFLSGYNVETPVSEGWYYPLTRVLSFGVEVNF